MTANNIKDLFCVILVLAGAFLVNIAAFKHNPILGMGVLGATLFFTGWKAMQTEIS